MMSGRQPIAVKECADSTWGDWRPHLAMILSNSKSAKDDLDIRSIKTLGDTLHDKGFLYAGQFCYLMAGLDFSSYENKSSKLVLIGGDVHADNGTHYAVFIRNVLMLSEQLKYIDP